MLPCHCAAEYWPACCSSIVDTLPTLIISYLPILKTICIAVNLVLAALSIKSKPDSMSTFVKIKHHPCFTAMFMLTLINVKSDNFFQGIISVFQSILGNRKYSRKMLSNFFVHYMRLDKRRLSLNNNIHDVSSSYYVWQSFLAVQHAARCCLRQGRDAWPSIVSADSRGG